MTDDELLSLVNRLRASGGDVADVEAKRAGPQLPRSVRETISAFSNTTGGGTLILGLDEAANFSVSGVDDPAKMSADLASTCATEMEPAIRPRIAVHTLDGVPLVVAEIPEIDPSQKPCYYIAAGMTNGSYIRVGDGDYRLNPYEVQMLVASRGQPREDERPVEGSTIADLDSTSVSRLLMRVRETRPRAFADLSDDDALRRLRLVVENERGDIVPSGIPEFTSRVASFQVAFPNHTLMSADTIAWIEQLGQEGLTNSQCISLALMRDGRTLTNATYRASTGVDSRVATAECQDLVARELIEQEGQRRWATYTISRSALAPRSARAARLTPADRRPEILAALGRETRSRAEIAALTGLKPQTVRRWLLTLREENLVEIIGKPQSNSARYRSLAPSSPIVAVQPQIDGWDSANPS